MFGVVAKRPELAAGLEKAEPGTGLLRAGIDGTQGLTRVLDFSLHAAVWIQTYRQ